MPRLAPQAGTPITEELTGEVDDALKSAKKVLDAAATAKLLEGVKTVTGGDGSSTKELSEIVSAVASNLKSTGELQANLISQMADLAKREIGANDGEFKSMINQILLVKTIESLGQNSGRGISPEMEKYLDLLREENQRLREEVKELKENRRPSPVEEQFQSLMMQIVNQRLGSSMDPIQFWREMARAREDLREFFAQDNVPPEYTEGALKAKALEKEMEALRVDENIKLRELEQKKEIYSNVIPKAVETLAGVLTSFGLAPVQPLHFSQEAVAEAQRMVGPEGTQ
ncbi:MAG: hypothetical protein K6U74_02190 [Firmicutes bacterium]|nr:hypothetical protein [Bacillota bacterium]